MSSDWEFVTETGEIEDDLLEIPDEIEDDDLVPEPDQVAERRKKKKKLEDELDRGYLQAVSFLAFGILLTFLISGDLLEKIRKVEAEHERNDLSLSNIKSSFESEPLTKLNGNIMHDKEFQRKVKKFMAEVRKHGSRYQPSRCNEETSAFYLLSERSPILISLRRRWIPDYSLFRGVTKFVHDMEWDHTFEEELFIKGVPDFDPTFQSKEPTFKVMLKDQYYNRAFINIGKKEMLGKRHSIEHFTVGRVLVRLEMQDGNEISRREIFIKHGDLHIFDRIGDFECTRVYYSANIEPMMLSKIYDR